MSRRSLPPGVLAVLLAVTVGVFSLGCGSLWAEPAELLNVRPGPCGTIVGEVQGSGERVLLTLDGVDIDTVDTPGGGGKATFQVRADLGPHVLSHRESAVDHPVTVPPPVVDLSWTGMGEEVREGQSFGPVKVGLVSACPVEELQVEATVDGQKVPVQASGSDVMVEPGVLSEGTHGMGVRVRYAGVQVASQSFDLEIGPPCTRKACKDRDRDGYASTAFGGEDCDDTEPAVHPGATHPPDPDGDGKYAVLAMDWDCDGTKDYAADADFDCDEGNPRIPRPEELEPTGVDEDCDGLVDEGTRAYDDDGDGVNEEQGDCRDDDASVAPGKRELADCKDNDCDGQVDNGVTRAEKDDEFEPNDKRPWALRGAQKKTGFFGGYTTTRESVQLVLRDASDVETFTLFAHDGTLDSFHVTVQLDSIGDGLAYDVRVTGPNRSSATFKPQRGVAGKKGLEKFRLVTTGTGFRSDTGEYTITVKPRGKTPPYCPLKLTISSG